MLSFSVTSLPSCGNLLSSPTFILPPWHPLLEKGKFYGCQKQSRGIGS